MRDTPSPCAIGSAAAPWAVLIIGAGFGGLAMAIALRQAGERDVVVLEKANDVGGVWRENTYPGAACDVPSHLYSFSFEPNPRWSRTYSPQPEILDYLRHCASKYQVREQLRFGCEVTGAAFDEAQALWRVAWRDAQGGTHQGHARMLVSAVGLLSRPAIPAIDGRADFVGPAFHSARWRHDVSLKGQRVAVIGTGASAIQFVPEIAREAAQLTVLQRTPSWILPRADRAYTAAERRRFERWPWLMAWHRAAIYAAHDARAVGFTRVRWLLDVVGGMPARKQLRQQVADPALRERLTPGYPIGCKRILISNDWLPTLSRTNVELVTEAVARITPAGVRLAGGREIAVDAIVYGTGFAASEFLAPMEIRGRGGLRLNDAWAHGAQAYLGISVPRFPNFFMVYGPNTNLGHNSIVFMLECQVAHVMRCLRKASAARAATIEVDDVPFGRYNARLQRRSQQTVFAGCTSWYVDAQGRHTVNWPGFTTTYRWLTRHASLASYTVRAGAPA
jgi:cyclohexanone monooxygenase